MQAAVGSLYLYGVAVSRVNQDRGATPTCLRYFDR